MEEIKMTKKKEVVIDIDAGKIQMKKKVLDVTIKDIYGGDGEVRYQEMEYKNLSRVKTTQKTKEHMPKNVGKRKITEIITEVIDEPVKTFKLIDGKPIIALGKKIRGTLKAIGINYARMEHPTFPSQAFARDIMSMINVEPETLVLTDDKKWMENGNYYLATSPQIMNTAGKAMITQHFDAIKEVNTQIIIKYPSTFESQVSALVELLPSVKTLNRRASTIEIKNIHDSK